MKILKKNKKLVFLIIYMIVVFVVFYIFMCYHPSDKPLFDKKNNSLFEDYNTKRKIIIDTDGGADDAAAIMMLASASNIDIIGITCTSGNTSLENAGKNVLQTLEELKKDNIGVYLGNDRLKEKINDKFLLYGKDGMGDKGLIHPKKKVSNKSATKFIIDTIKNNSNNIEVVCLGPLTNIAESIKKDCKVMSKVKRYWIMGSQGLGVGNASPVAEFNVYNDAEAFDTVLSTNKECILVPYNTSQEVASIDGSELDEMSKISEHAKFLISSFSRLREHNKKKFNNDFVCMCDVALASIVINGKVINDEIFTYAKTVTDKGIAYGQVIFYEKEQIDKSDSKNNKLFCHLIIGENKDLFMSMLYNTLE